MYSYARWQIIQFTPEDDEIDQKCTFWERGKVTNNFWMWYQMIQRQYLDFEGGGVKQSPLESYKISIIMYGWEGYGWEWIIRGGGGSFFMIRNKLPVLCILNHEFNMIIYVYHQNPNNSEKIITGICWISGWIFGWFVGYPAGMP